MISTADPRTTATGPDTAPIRVEVVQSETAWAELESEWTALFDASASAAAPLHFAWLNLWWQVYGPHYGRPGIGLQIITVRRGDHLIGALPLYQNCSAPAVGVRRLRFLSTGEAGYEEICPEYLNLLCRPGEEAACARAVADAMRGLAWDALELVDVPDDSPLVTGTDFAQRVGRCRITPQGNCPVANLEGGFEAYLQRLSANSRQQARRLLREAEKAGAAFELAGALQAEKCFDDLVRLHQARWRADGKPGCFAAPRFTAFHRALVTNWLPSGRAVLARLSLDGQSVAVLYGFHTGAKFDFYQSGVSPAPPSCLRSPGNLAHLLLMKELCVRGVRCYDFLSGAASYKDRLATGENRLVLLQCWRPTLRAIAHRTSRAVGRAVFWRQQPDGV